MDYADLPLKGLIILKTGEVAEYRASTAYEFEGKTIVKDAYFRFDGEIIGPFKIELSKNQSLCQG